MCSDISYSILFHLIVKKKGKTVISQPINEVATSNTKGQAYPSFSSDRPRFPDESSQCHLLGTLGIASAFSQYKDFSRMRWNQRNLYTDTVCASSPNVERALKQFKEKFRWMANTQTKLWILRSKTPRPIPKENFQAREQPPDRACGCKTHPGISGFQTATDLGPSTLAFHKKPLWSSRHTPTRESLLCSPWSNLCL